MASHLPFRPARPMRWRATRLVGLPLTLAALLALAWTPLAVAVAARPASQARSLTPICPPGSQLRAGDYTPGVPFAHIIHVPADQPTIQAGVNTAQPSDLVLVAPRIYRENVVVCTANITIRGMDRDTTILERRRHRPQHAGWRARPAGARHCHHQQLRPR